MAAKRPTSNANTPSIAIGATFATSPAISSSKYAQMRGESFKNDGDGHEATEFYRQNRAAMDDGAIIAWPQRHNTDELSAIQHAMNLKLQDEAAYTHKRNSVFAYILSAWLHRFSFRCSSRYCVWFC